MTTSSEEWGGLHTIRLPPHDALSGPAKERLRLLVHGIGTAPKALRTLQVQGSADEEHAWRTTLLWVPGQVLFLAQVRRRPGLVFF